MCERLAAAESVIFALLACKPGRPPVGSLMAVNTSFQPETP